MVGVLEIISRRRIRQANKYYTSRDAYLAHALTHTAAVH